MRQSKPARQKEVADGGAQERVPPPFGSIYGPMNEHPVQVVEPAGGASGAAVVVPAARAPVGAASAERTKIRTTSASRDADDFRFLNMRASQAEGRTGPAWARPPAADDNKILLL
jgi:hypothetical protein